MAGVKGRSGGVRVGSGRPKRDAVTSWLMGNPGKREPKAGPMPVVLSAPPGPVEMPDDLEPDEAAVWRKQAPFAIANGTLTPATAMAFAWLCETIVLTRRLSKAPLAQTGPDHRGMMQRMEAGLARFRLIADGKPVVSLEPPKDEWAEFEAAPLRAVK